MPLDRTTPGRRRPPRPVVDQDPRAQLRRSLVPRERLVERLARGSSGRLTLVSAPAGWGRTTAVLEWRRWVAGRHRFAWVSLDADDSDPARFWAYVVHALAEALPERLHEPLRLTEIGADPRQVPSQAW